MSSRRYSILSRLNTGILAKSIMSEKTAAAISIPPTARSGKGVMPIPHAASAEAIATSTADNATSIRLGREVHRRRRSRFV